MASGVAAASVAVIEFSGIAANRQLANVLPAGSRFAVVDLLVHYFGGNPPITELAGKLSSGLDPSTTMIVANCSDASLAFAVAALHRSTADVLVVSPERITDDTVRTEFAERYGSLGARRFSVRGHAVEFERSDQPVHRPAVWAPGATDLDIADRTHAQAGALGYFLLGESEADPAPTQQNSNRQIIAVTQGDIVAVRQHFDPRPAARPAFWFMGLPVGFQRGRLRKKKLYGNPSANRQPFGGQNQPEARGAQQHRAVVVSNDSSCSTAKLAPPRKEGVGTSERMGHC